MAIHKSYIAYSFNNGKSPALLCAADKLNLNWDRDAFHTQIPLEITEESKNVVLNSNMKQND